MKKMFQKYQYLSSCEKKKYFQTYKVATFTDIQKVFIEFTYNTVIFFLLAKIWVFGMIERDTNKVILYPVEKRDEATLLPLI